MSDNNIIAAKIATVIPRFPTLTGKIKWEKWCNNRHGPEPFTSDCVMITSGFLPNANVSLFVKSVQKRHKENKSEHFPRL